MYEKKIKIFTYIFIIWIYLIDYSQEEEILFRDGYQELIGDVPMIHQGEHRIFMTITMNQNLSYKLTINLF